MSDGRQFPRVADSANLKWRVIVNGPQTGPTMRGLQLNISGGGICFLSNDPVPEGKMVALELQLPGFPSAILAMGKVVWSKPAPDAPGEFEIGAEFHWIGWDSAAAQEQVLNYIRRKLN